MRGSLPGRKAGHAGALHHLPAVFKENHALFLDADVDIVQAVSQLKLGIGREHRDKEIVLRHHNLTVQRLWRLLHRAAALALIAAVALGSEALDRLGLDRRRADRNRIAVDALGLNRLCGGLALRSRRLRARRSLGGRRIRIRILDENAVPERSCQHRTCGIRRSVFL